MIDLRRDDGSATAFTVVIVPALLMVAGLVLDLGLAMNARVRALAVAEEAARAGAGALDPVQLRHGDRPTLDPVRAQAAARSYLAGVGESGTVNATTGLVTVTVRLHQRAELLRLIGISGFNIAGTATAIPATSIVNLNGSTP
ncbi:pilus assembly protein TadG-related protein [Catenulispora pinisilvae]|uniref:pilus assembly protein TadG-related protein n=1 Tax=Catenulispora pinisilvae TaxID=2705253 RepID=UPI0018920A22|nr:pilus assembly protein TadG-related protein [Catenulispora pinisilvae]